jgi:hypothetical protein
MINVFKMKKTAALVLAGAIPTIFFTIALMYYGLWWALGAFLLSLVISYLAGNALLNNPLRSMLEGKGILVFDYTSTGILQPFIVGVDNPFIQGEIRGKAIEDVFDRKAVHSMAAPVINKKGAVPNKKGGLTIELDEKEYSEARFAFFHFPVLFYNSQIGSLLTKEFLDKNEKEAFAAHGILYANHAIKRLSDEIKPFSRYVVDTTKPKKNILGQWWVWVIIIFFLLLFAAMIIPKLFPAAGGALSSLTSTLDTVTPK